MSKKVDRVVNGPGWGEVFLGAFLSLLLGAVLGAVLLVIRPVAQVKDLPKEADRVKNTVYYIEGSRDTGKARQALAKRKQFAEGQAVAVTEDEINSLMPAANTPAAAAPKAGAKKDEKKDEKAAPAAPASSDLLASAPPTVRIRDGVFQVGAPVTVNLMGLSHKVLVHGKGGFAKKGDVFVFAPDQLYLGSCPVQRVPFLGSYVMDKFVSSQTVPEDIATAWRKLTSVTVEGSTLKLAVQ